MRGRERHGMANTPTYSSWEHMISRCYNPNNDWYHIYGGKGIKICDAWKNSFVEFYKDMGDRPDGRTLDRINSDGNYEPGNCRWATPSEQSINRGKQSNNTSGYPGIRKSHNKTNPWKATIQVNKKVVHLGYFKSFRSALNARKQAEPKYWGIGQDSAWS